MQELARAIDGKGSDFSTSALDLASIAAFYVPAVLTADWRPAKVFDNVVLSPAGSKLAEGLRVPVLADGSSPDEREVKAALFISFAAANNLLIDVLRTSAMTSELVAALNGDVLAGTARFPWIVGTQPQEVYASICGRWAQDVDLGTTLDLLDALPRGAFQIGRLAVGARGALLTPWRRWSPPMRALPAFRCSDQHCSAIHRVALATSETRVAELFARIGDLLKLNPAGSISLAREMVDQVDSRFCDDAPLAVPFALVQMLDADELAAVVAKLADADRPHFARTLEMLGAQKKELGRSTAALVGDLCVSGLFQVVSSYPDDRIVAAVDRLIWEGVIDIRPDEVRRANLVPTTRRTSSSRYAIAAHGWRHGLPGQAAMRLKRFISSAYSGGFDDQDLHWNLEGLVGFDRSSATIDDAVRQFDPVDIAQRLILHSRDAVDRASANLVLAGIRDTPPSLGRESVASAIAWKAGFSLPPRASYLRLFAQRAERLREDAASLLRDSEPSDDAKDAVRGSGANFFVSLEEILDHLLCFSAWALCADHVAANSPFTYQRPTAKAFALGLLSGIEVSDGLSFMAPSDGNLSLGSCELGIAALRQWLVHLPEREEEFRRPPPNWAATDSLFEYPFSHTVPFLDLDGSSRDQILQFMDFVLAEMSRAAVANVRNRVDHWREEARRDRSFPSSLEIEATIDAVARVVERASDLGLLPQVSVVSVGVDALGRRRVRLTTGDGREFCTWSPHEHDPLPMPPQTARQIVVRGGAIGGGIDVLRFWPGDLTRERADLPRYARPTIAFEEAAAYGDD